MEYSCIFMYRKNVLAEKNIAWLKGDLDNSLKLTNKSPDRKLYGFLANNHNDE